MPSYTEISNFWLFCIMALLRRKPKLIIYTEDLAEAAQAGFDLLEKNDWKLCATERVMKTCFPKPAHIARRFRGVFFYKK